MGVAITSSTMPAPPSTEAIDPDSRNERFFDGTTSESASPESGSEGIVPLAYEASSGETHLAITRR